MSDAPGEPMLAPGAVIGILGGGQLGRMLAWSAQRLGFHAHIFCQNEADPAAQVARRVTLGGWDDTAALDRFAEAVDVVTLEFENVPLAAVERLAATVPVRPGGRALAIAQDRREEKAFARSTGVPTADYCSLVADDDGAALADLTFPAILKTARLGYDGKGQARVASAAAALAEWQAWGKPAAIVETVVPFRRELSILIARTPSGEMRILPLAENRHEDGILRETLAPAVVDDRVQQAAETLAIDLACSMQLEGLCAFELFELADGQLFFNEMAPRPHNSGHWTLDACIPDQFELAVRAMCGWPLPNPLVLARARMRNLLGTEMASWADLASAPGRRVHLYGKDVPAPGRKMGHVTDLLLDQSDDG